MPEEHEGLVRNQESGPNIIAIEPGSIPGVGTKVLFPCSSVVEQLTVNQLVGSSKLPEGAKLSRGREGESRQAHTLKVAGAIPASATI